MMEGSWRREVEVVGCREGWSSSGVVEKERMKKLEASGGSEV